MKKFFPVISLTIILVILGMLYILNSTREIPGDSTSLCLNVGGLWSEEYRECTGIDAVSCEKIGGKFNECASACRHTQQEICTLQCVQVCEIK